MLYYSRSGSDYSSSKFAGVLLGLVIILAMFLANFSRDYLHIEKLSMAVFTFVVMGGVLMLATLKGGYVKKGRLESTNGRLVDNGSCEPDLIVVNGELGTVFDSLENGLVGHPINPFPKNYSVWNFLSSDRARGQVLYTMKVTNPDEKCAYTRLIGLELNLRQKSFEQVEIELKYDTSSPLMNRVKSRVASATTPLVADIAKDGPMALTTDIEIDNPSPREEVFEIDYLEESKKQSLESFDLQQVVEKVKAAAISSDVKSEAESQEQFVVTESDTIEPSQQATLVETAFDVKPLVLEDTNHTSKEESAEIGLADLGQISYTNFNFYADTILDSNVTGDGETNL